MIAPRSLFVCRRSLACLFISVCACDGGSSARDGATADDRDLPGDSAAAGTRDGAPLRLAARVVATYPHATDAYTEGLAYSDGVLFESTGLEGKSQLRRVALESGEVLEAVDLEKTVFAEGLAVEGDRLVQLTWQSGRALEWSKRTMELMREYTYPGEGWGLCSDGRQFVMSDGSDVLQLRDLVTFELIGTLKVHVEGIELRALRLNELECVDGAVFANVYEYRQIVRISLRDGEATAWIDTHNLLQQGGAPAEGGVPALDLNGIAYVPERESFLLTGKNWPWVFEVEWIPDQLFQ